MPKNVVQTDRAPAAIGPYSQAIVADGLVFCSGQIALDPRTASMVAGGIEAETRQVLDNLGEVLRAAGAGWSDVVKTTIYLTDFSDYPTVNSVYAERFSEAAPARAAIQVSALPKGAKVEIEAVARLEKR